MVLTIRSREPFFCKAFSQTQSELPKSLVVSDLTDLVFFDWELDLVLLSSRFTLINTIKQKANKWQVVKKFFFTNFYCPACSTIWREYIRELQNISGHKKAAQNSIDLRI